MKPILAAFVLAMQTIKSKADAALAGMGPVDQFEGAREVSYALNTLGWAAKEVESMLSQVAALEAKFDPEVQAAAALLVEASISEKIAAGEFVKKADLDIAVGAAELRGKTEAEAAAQIAAAAVAQIANRRAEITTAHGAEVAAAVPEEILNIVEFAPVAAELARRVQALDEIGVTAAAKPASFADVACSIPFDEAGKTAFDIRFAAAKELAGPVAAKTPAEVAASLRSTKVPGSGPTTIPTGKTDATLPEPAKVAAAAF